MLGVTIFFFFAPGGFWLGYVGTRTILTKLFDAIDSLKPEDVETAGRAENLKFDTSANRIVPASDGLAQADRALLATPWEETTTARQKAAWGAAQARAGNMRAAQDALESANKLDPNDAGIRQQLATLYMVLGRREDAERLTPENAVSEVALFNALYQPEPTGFTKAIEIGEQLASRPGAEKNGNLHTWLACAYGQKYRFVMNQNPNDETLPSIRTAVLREIRAAIAADSNARVLLHSAWKPPVGGPDNDLNGFSQDDPDLKGLLEPS